MGLALAIAAPSCGSEDRPKSAARNDDPSGLESPVAFSRLATVRKIHAGASNRSVVESSNAHFSRDGDSLLARVDDTRYAKQAVVTLPARADGATKVENRDSGIALAFRLRDATSAAVGTADGVAVYAGGGPDGGDVFQRVTAEGTEDFVVVHRGSSVSYSVDVENVAGLRLVENVLELLDENGTPRLRVSGAHVVDAEGERHPADLTLSGCDADGSPAAPWGRPVTAPGSTSCEVRVSWSDDVDAYPVLVDPYWVATGSLTTDFTDPDGILLENGLALVASGGTVNLYDPGTGTFAVTGSQVYDRAGPVYALVTGGKVLAAGYNSSGSSNEAAELYDPAQGTWALTGSMTVGRGSGHTVTGLVSGKALVAGGEAIGDPPSDLAEVFDPAANGGVGAFEAPLSMGTPLGRGIADHAAVRRSSGNVLLTGGIEDGGTIRNRTYVFNPNGNGGLGTFTAGPGMNAGRRDHQAVVLANGDVLVYGGQWSGGACPCDTADLLSGGSWTELADIPSGVSIAHLLPSGDVLVGWGPGNDTVYRSGVFLNLGSSSDALFPHTNPASISLADGRVLLAGGSGAPTSAEIFGTLAGGSCTSDSQCVDGHCLDDICCESDCTTPCFACLASENGVADGQCLPALAGTDPGNDCADQGAATCGEDGTCDGSGGCRLYLNGSACSTASCSGATLQAEDVCDGSGTCVDQGTVPCDPYLCGSSTSCGTSCLANGDCTPGGWCRTSDSTCQPDKDTGQPCGSPAECLSGNCIDGVCCDAPCAGTCVACTAAKKGSGNDGECGNVAAGADPDSECAAEATSTCGQDGACDGAGSCRLHAPGTACGTTTCSGGQQNGFSCDGFGSCDATGIVQCAPFVCCGTACCSTCSSHADCAASSWCRSSDNSCQPDKANGGTCGDADECISGNCVDGVCCDQACDSACVACTAALKGTGSDGNCGPIANGTDPDGDCPDDGSNSCARDGRCNGSGGCRLYANGTACGAGTCSSGVQTGVACDGFGMCVPNVTVNCDPYFCAGNSCDTACGSHSECVADHYCASDTSCQPDKAIGEACVDAEECQGGRCVDGFCCDAPCAATCQACSAAKTGGTDGTCAPILADTDPDNECTDDGPCGQNGACSGLTSCKLYASGTACGTTTCVSGVQTGFACDGAGSCDPGQTTQCAPFLCNGGACGTTCASDADCVASAFCSSTSLCVGDLQNGADCSRDSMCVSGECVDGKCCDQPCDGLCEACSVAKKGAGADGVCGAVGAGLDPDNDCAADNPDTCGLTGNCDGARACQLYGTTTQCGTAVCSGNSLVGRLCDGFGVCVDGQSSPCAPFACMSGICFTTCADETDCAPGHFCAGGSCTPKLAAGATCSGGVECQTGFCVDGVCCDTACDGLCQACEASLKESGAGSGACGFTAQGVRDGCVDDGEPSCDRNGTCDGQGGCALYPASTVCAATRCEGSTQVGSACDGAGTCAPDAVVDCGLYACVGVACVTSCTDDTDCAESAYCDGAGACVPKLGDGETCDDARTCTSGLCVDGYCCNQACAGQCEACDLPTALGRCSPVNGVPHGQRPPCTPAEVDDPCTERACRGEESTSECSGFVGAEVTCREASCSGGLETAAETCDGEGRCPAPQTAPCEPYVCGTTACLRTCETDADCAEPDLFRCVTSLGSCEPKEAAICEDEVTVLEPDDTRKDCTPYLCVGGTCASTCEQSTECTTGYVCDTTEARCVETEAPADSSGDSGGCACRSGSKRGPSSSWMLAALSLLLVRRRRSA